MKTLLIIICFLTICSCGGFNGKTCHESAKSYLFEKGYKVDTSIKIGGYTYLYLTEDSAVIWIHSGGIKYPYVTDMKILRNY